MALPPEIQALLDGRIVRVAHLVEFDFLTQNRRVWNGSYKLNTGGHDWFGLRKLGMIEGLEDAGALESSELRFSVSGVDPRFLEFFTMAAEESKDEYVNRLVRVYELFRDEDWQPIGDPQAAAVGIMDNIGIESRPIMSEGKQYTQRVISITAQNIFHGRGRPPASFYTFRDQQNRSEGDRGLEYIHELVETNIETPW